MSSATPIYGLPYPVPSDSVNIAEDIQNLAEAVESTISHVVAQDLIGDPLTTTASQTVTNKTIAFDQNTISNVPISAVTGLSDTLSTLGTNDQAYTDHMNATSSVHGLTSGDGDVVGTSSNQALTNKTISLANNTITGNISQFNSALSGTDFVTTDGTETLTNKSLASPNLTGTPVAPTAAADTSTTQVATTEYVINQGYLKSSTASSTYAPLASPTLTGIPKSTTASADTNTTQIATTAFVVGQASSISPAMNGTASAGTSLKYARADHVHPVDTSRQPLMLTNKSYTDQSITAATRTYINGSNLSFTAGTPIAGTRFRWTMALTKTAAGTAASTFDIAIGTAGTTSDTARVSFTKPAGTAVADTGYIIIDAFFTAVGSSGAMLGQFNMTHNLASTGFAAIPSVNISAVSATFDSSTATNIGVCATTGASDAYTIKYCVAESWNI